MTVHRITFDKKNSRRNGKKTIVSQIIYNDETLSSGVNFVDEKNRYNVDKIDQGRKAWAALHSKRDPTREWFETEWKPLIPQGCGCSGSANALLDQKPPRFDSPEEFFCWSVEYHNAVNQKLIDQGDTTKKIVSMEEALAIWRPIPT